MKVNLLDVRLAFPVLWTAQKVLDSEKLTFSAVFLFDESAKGRIEKEGVKTSGNLMQLLEDAQDAVGLNKWGTKWPSVKKALIAADKMAVHNGDTKAQYSGYEGMHFINASSSRKPRVLDRQRNDAAEGAEGAPFSGCYVNGALAIWAMANKWGNRINAELTGVQYLRKGEAFSAGAGPASLDEFDDLGVEDDDEDDSML